MPIEAKIFPKVPTAEEVKELKTLRSPYVPEHMGLTGKHMYLQFCYRMTKFNNELEHLDPITAQSWLNAGATRLYHEIEKRFFNNPDDPGLMLFFRKYLTDVSAFPSDGTPEGGEWTVDIINKNNNLKLTPSPIDIFAKMPLHIGGYSLDDGATFHWFEDFCKYYKWAPVEYKEERKRGYVVDGTNNRQYIICAQSIQRFARFGFNHVLLINPSEGYYGVSHILNDIPSIKVKKYKLDNYSYYFGGANNGITATNRGPFTIDLVLSGQPSIAASFKMDMPATVPPNNPTRDARFYLLDVDIDFIDEYVNLGFTEAKFWSLEDTVGRHLTLFQVTWDIATQKYIVMFSDNSDPTNRVIYMVQCTDYRWYDADPNLFPTGRVVLINPVFGDQPEDTAFRRMGDDGDGLLGFDTDWNLFRVDTINGVDWYVFDPVAGIIDAQGEVVLYFLDTNEDYITILCTDEQYDNGNWDQMGFKLTLSNDMYVVEGANIQQIRGCRLYFAEGMPVRMDYRDLEDNDMKRMDFWLSNSFSELQSGLNSRLYMHRENTGSPLRIYTNTHTLNERNKRRSSMSARQADPRENIAIDHVEATALDLGRVMNEIFINTSSEVEYIGFPPELHNDIVDYSIDAYFESVFFQSFGKYSMKQGRQDYQEATQTNSRLNKLDAVPPNRFKLK